ncbi:helix-turn-helix domain-containing protein [Saccharopolyspora spinosa]|uniref:Excisionase family DNA binding protein n=1 Tax=Saccharopolyspora spinosa TaxID=60894 RepID=A0A2N3Y7D4_SACSN|nr:helix-turn-helix domain-containing protein [Saccharopolyspora spinosa]PKW18788.1 excisionase family DNA binding protein [Saccharopolyspora spinosa]
MRNVGRSAPPRRTGLKTPRSTPASEPSISIPATEDSQDNAASEQQTEHASRTVNQGTFLYTAEEVADLLRVRPSWLRRKASARAIPCRFLGKHLRFSRSDIAEIAGIDPPTASNT